MRRSLHFAGLGVAIAALYLGGGLSFVERYLLDARASLGARPATGELVIVAIDPESLHWLEVWPWPRRYYADAIEALLAAGVERIALDIDFSSFAAPEDDQRLAEAVATAGPERLALPSFRQLHPARDGSLEIVDTAPNSLLAPHVRQVHANFQPDPDGLVRRLEADSERQGRRIPAMAVWLRGRPTGASATIQLDFSIEAASIPRLSFVDVLEGSFDPAAVAGRQVIIGATATELGDQASVPRYRVLPGTLVQALAFETLAQDRALVTIAGWPMALISLCLCWVLGIHFTRPRAGPAFALAGGLALASSLLATLLQPLAAVALEVSPCLLAMLAACGLALLQLLQRKDALMRQVVDNSFDAILTFDDGRFVRSFNRAAERLFACPSAAILGTPLAELLTAPDDGPEDSWLLGQGGPHELSARPRSGPAFPVEAAVSTMWVDDRRVGIVAVRDITERKRQEAELRRLAMHDPLTGLPNRALLHDRLERAVLQARRSGTRVALLLLDLDRFKEVNDTLGHQVGDVLLQQIGPRLQGALRAVDTLARLGGDEFAVVLIGMRDDDACAVAERIIDLLRWPFQVEAVELELGASIGVACFPEHGEQAPELLQRADVAMYAAKRAQTGFALYSAGDDRHSLRRLTLHGELRRAIEDGQIEVHYQPKVATATGRLTGLEALVRWQHPEHGLVPPDEFVGLAEQTGLIRPLTGCVLATVLRQQRAWRERGLDLAVAVNLSVRLLQDAGGPDRMRELIDRLGGTPQRLALEITESALMVDPATALAVLDRLAALGCRLSLDDFGTGYSSLAYLQKLPIDELKIDRSFVLAMDQDSGAATIVRSVVQLAHSLELAVVAEGVETRAAYDRLAALGCDQVQGFWIGRPMAADALDSWLASAPCAAALTTTTTTAAVGAAAVDRPRAGTKVTSG